MRAARSRGLKVLAADDNPVNRKLLIAALRALGHTGVVVNDGEKVLRCLSQLQFDLVLLDVQMPVMDGLQALAGIRALEQSGRPHMPVIMVTANDLPGDRQRFIQKGADGYVAKPVDVEVLHKEIQQVLGSFEP